MLNYQPLPDKHVLREMFHYDPHTGLLTRKRAGKGGNAPIGDAVGCPNASGHLRVKMKARGYAVHRLIWRMVTGEDPELDVIDHKDLNPANNRWGNLRRVSYSINCLNSNRTNKSKVYPGVHRNKGRWVARIGVNYRRVHLGYFDNVEDAIAARKAAEVQLGTERSDDVLIQRGTK
jgi:hypothetical protein